MTPRKNNCDFLNVKRWSPVDNPLVEWKLWASGITCRFNLVWKNC